MGGSFLTLKPQWPAQLNCWNEGADLLDLGAESTRPGSQVGSASKGADGQPAAPAVSAATVSAAEEQARLLPVLKRIL